VIIAWAATYLGIVIAPFMTLGPVVAKESLGGAASWGIIAAGWGVGSLTGGLVALRWRPVRPMFTCTLLVLLIAPAVALLALRAPAPVIATAQAIGGIGMGVFSAVWQTTLQEQVPEEALSRVSAWDWMGSFLFLPLGLIAAGPVSELIGISTTLWIAVAWAVGSTLVVLLVPGVRNLRRRDEPEPEDVLAGLRAEPAEALHGS
jgi:hypothetical protein